ncbi:ATP synthase subunit g, mitochondrial-like [Paramacrobiotus metropolitanus]|uniref:ATP synthase subunit g, mitochondrial-like n=1 Tax=Paramacrobiotus metropolitanus TaxID=2943436 RepID=UPI00244572D6|nr:ATP synthase subunit g, mitochondrial-like [Paramacrobiotus metropolitanus]
MAKLVAKIGPALQTAMTNARPGLNTAWKYARSELRPPTPGEIPQGIAGISGVIAGVGRRSWRKLTVKEAWLNTLVGIEIACWFFVGEVIARRNLIGYGPGWGYKGHH